MSHISNGKHLQELLLPRTIPFSSQLDIAAVSETARLVGGDYYDFYRISDSKLALIMADASGHGSPAAFRAQEMKNIFQALAATSNEPRELALRANELVIQSFERGTFVTAVIVFFDVATGIGSLVRCGHNYPALWVGGSLTVAKPGGLGLGISTKDFERVTEAYNFSLSEGDTLLIYTDGLVEAKSADEREEFGLERFMDAFTANVQLPSEQLIFKLLGEVKSFTSEMSDDMTLMALKRR